MALTNQQLLRQARTAQDRMEMAKALWELAERAETEPMLQEILRKIELPAPFNVIEYRKCENRKGYWARIPYTREHPSINELQAKLDFSEINYSLFGTKGTVERLDGTKVSLESHFAGEMMKGRKIVSEEKMAERQRQRSIERIARATGVEI